MGQVYSEPACQLAYDGDLQRLYVLLRDDPRNLNIQEDDNGDTPLIAACRHGNVHVTRYLLDNGADPHLTNKKQRTCLHYASRRTLSAVDYLMIAVLMPILLLGYFLLLQKQRQNAAQMEALLSAGADVNAVDYKGNTALHYLCLRKNHHLVPLLLLRNANTQIQNNDGETPVDIASRLKFKKIVRMLTKKQ